MKDSIYLLLTALACAAGAALFWRVTGEAGVTILLSISTLALTVDNARLRRNLRRQPGTAD